MTIDNRKLRACRVMIHRSECIFLLKIDLTLRVLLDRPVYGTHHQSAAIDFSISR